VGNNGDNVVFWWVEFVASFLVVCDWFLLERDHSVRHSAENYDKEYGKNGY